MHISRHSYRTAAVAVIGAGAIALGPVQPLTARAAPIFAAPSTQPVNLVAAFDPITPWVQTVQTAAANLSGLFAAWSATPFPIAEQVITNLGVYFSELPDIGTILEQVSANASNAVNAPAAADINTLDLTHLTAYGLLSQLARFPQLDFTTSSASGLFMGFLGPVIGPALALQRSISSAVAALQTADFIGALNEVINIPAAMTNAFLNGGQTIDLTSLVAPLIPAPSTLISAGISVGGLLSTGSSLFNALGLDALVVVDPFLPAVPVYIGAGPGPGIVGSMIAMTNAVATAIAVTPVVPAAGKIPGRAAATRKADRSGAATIAKSPAKRAAGSATASRRAG
ncbi:MAG: hypothetical protein ACR2JI_15180 [Mycobacterium sp.]